MNDGVVHRGPDGDGAFAEVRSRWRRAGSRSSTSSTATSRSRTRTARVSSSRTARSTTTASCARELERRGHRFARARHRGARPPLRGARPLRRAAAGDVRDRALGLAPQRRLLLARDRFGIKPLYYRHADGDLSFASELKAMLEHPGFSREIDPRRAGGLPRLQLDPGAADDLHARRASCPPGHLLSGEDGEISECAATPGRPGRRRRACARGRREELADELREGLRDSRPRPPRRRRPGRRVPLRRVGLRRRSWRSPPAESASR